MKEFLINNWKLILEISCAVFALVFMCIRKKPVKVVDTLKEIICRLLPCCLNQAEKSELKGDDKKVFALKLLDEALKELGFELGDYGEFASEQLEIILSTPQKKGEGYEKKNKKC